MCELPPSTSLTPLALEAARGRGGEDGIFGKPLTLSNGKLICVYVSIVVNRVNVVEGEPENRSMTTGLHTVKDISCSKCGNLLGWRYCWFRSCSHLARTGRAEIGGRTATVKAFEPSQAYKEGQYILEKQKFTEVH